MELSLLDSEKYLVYVPSMIASSSLFIAAHILGELNMQDLERVSIPPTCPNNLSDPPLSNPFLSPTPF